MPAGSAKCSLCTRMFIGTPRSTDGGGLGGLLGKARPNRRWDILGIEFGQHRHVVELPSESVVKPMPLSRSTILYLRNARGE